VAINSASSWSLAQAVPRITGRVRRSPAPIANVRRFIRVPSRPRYDTELVGEQIIPPPRALEMPVVVTEQDRIPLAAGDLVICGGRGRWMIRERQPRSAAMRRPPSCRRRPIANDGATLQSVTAPD
jgi:hypothetical protein